MTLVYFCFNGNVKKLIKDEEFRWFFFFVLSAIIVVMVWILYLGFASDVENAFRKAAFQVVTLVSTCGFATDDYIPWGPFFWFIALILMFICGCAGSTCGGLKMGRFVILTKNLSNEFKKQTHPHAVIPVRMNGHVVSGVSFCVRLYYVNRGELFGFIFGWDGIFGGDWCRCFCYK